MLTTLRCTTLTFSILGSFLFLNVSAIPWNPFWVDDAEIEPLIANLRGQTHETLESLCAVCYKGIEDFDTVPDYEWFDSESMDPDMADANEDIRKEMVSFHTVAIDEICAIIVSILGTIAKLYQIKEVNCI